MFEIVKIGSTATDLINNPLVTSDIQRYEILSILLCNPSVSDETVDVHVIPDGDSLGDDNKIESGFSIVAGDSVSLNVSKMILETGDKIQAVGATGNLVNSVCNYILKNVKL